MYPWIQERKEEQQKEEYEKFQTLKAEDPAAAQAYIEALRKKETWLSRKIREMRDTEAMKMQEETEALELRAKYGALQPNFNDSLYEPLPAGAKRYHWPELSEIEQARMIGKSLSVPQPAKIDDFKSNVASSSTNNI